MDTETYDQLNFSQEIIGTAMDYLLPNSRGDGQTSTTSRSPDRDP
jgi:translation elongation factor P/translation initiation factor 5A